MSEQILEQYGRVTIYTEANHPSPIYHVDGDIQANPYGDLAALFEDDALEEVMYNGGTQCVKVAHRNHGMCRTNIWISCIEFNAQRELGFIHARVLQSFSPRFASSVES